MSLNSENRAIHVSSLRDGTNCVEFPGFGKQVGGAKPKGLQGMDPTASQRKIFQANLTTLTLLSRWMLFEKR